MYDSHNAFFGLARGGHFLLARATATFTREAQSSIFIGKTYMIRHSLKKSLFYFPLLEQWTVRENNKRSICFLLRRLTFEVNHLG